MNQKKIYVTGLGPGNADHMTGAALASMADADIVVGYKTYIDLIKDLDCVQGKALKASGMRKEVDRCQECLDLAMEGKTVTLVSSGDAGVYGMAGLLFELADQYGDVEIVVVAGVTAANSGAAVLGAPIGHDFCLISLSDLLTPWELIEKRLRCAAEADFAVCFYNPRSKKRDDYLAKACRIMMEHKPADTVCGWVKNIGRPGQEWKVTTLAELGGEPIDMFTTVFIGSRTTRVIGGRMVTPRGYEKHEDSYIRRDNGRP